MLTYAAPYPGHMSKLLELCRHTYTRNLTDTRVVFLSKKFTSSHTHTRTRTHCLHGEGAVEELAARGRVTSRCLKCGLVSVTAGYVTPSVQCSVFSVLTTCCADGSTVSVTNACSLWQTGQTRVSRVQVDTRELLLLLPQNTVHSLRHFYITKYFVNLNLVPHLQLS